MKARHGQTDLEEINHSESAFDQKKRKQKHNSASKRAPSIGGEMIPCTLACVLRPIKFGKTPEHAQFRVERQMGERIFLPLLFGAQGIVLQGLCPIEVSSTGPAVRLCGLSGSGTFRMCRQKLLGRVLDPNNEEKCFPEKHTRKKNNKRKPGSGQTTAT